jgi:hypothetical protein
MTEEIKKEFDVTELKKQLMGLFEENQKLEFTKKQHKEIAEGIYELREELKEFSDRLEKMADRIYPRIDITVRGANRDRSQVINELYELMVAGTHITTELVIKSHPDIDKISAQYIMAKLKEMPNVQKVRDGLNVRLFIK